MTSRHGLLIVISGPGGVGKDTLIQEMLRRDPVLWYSISYTTRPRRDYEVDGTHYTFVSVEEFRRMLEAGEFLEHAVVNANLYGTSAQRVEDAQAQGCDVLLKIDVQGAEQVRRLRPDGIFIFIAPPSMEELQARRHARGTESEAEMKQRQRLAAWEMSFSQKYDYIVVNDDVQRAADEVLSIINAERERRGVPV